jgi:hypothetical protein
MNIRANLRDVFRVLLETGPEDSNPLDHLAGSKEEPMIQAGATDSNAARKDRGEDGAF